MVIVFGVFFTPNEYRDVINHINNLSLFHLQLKLSAEPLNPRGGETIITRQGSSIKTKRKPRRGDTIVSVKAQV